MQWRPHSVATSYNNEPPLCICVFVFCVRVFVFVYIYMQQRPHSVAASYNESLAGSWEPSPATFVILSCRQHSRLHSTPSFLPPHPLPPLYSRPYQKLSYPSRLPAAYLPTLPTLPPPYLHISTFNYLYQQSHPHATIDIVQQFLPPAPTSISLQYGGPGSGTTY